MFAAVTIIGRLIADPEQREVGSTTKTQLKVSVNHGGKKPEGQQYPDSDVYTCEVWGPRGENACRLLTKGDPVFVTGRLEHVKGEKGGWLTIRNADWSFTGNKRAEEAAF